MVLCGGHYLEYRRRLFSLWCRNKPKSDLTEEEMKKKEDEEFQTGPLSVLTQAVKHNTQV